MKLSVLVCTRNRPQDIVWALPSILKSAYHDFEVVVVDQSDGYETAEIVHALEAGHPNLSYVRTDTRGLSRSRNVAMERATGEIIVFTDDDCEVDQEWLPTAAKIFQEKPQVDMVFGQVHMAEDLPQGASVPCLYFKERRVLHDGQIFGMGANMAYRRSLIDRIGFYDVALGPGAVLPCGDDFDYSYRAQLAGALVVADPRLCLIHRAHRLPEEWLKVQYLYGQGDAGFAVKHARCGDLKAALVPIKTLVSRGSRVLLKILLRRPYPSYQISYLKGYLLGLRKSLALSVNREGRLYKAERATAQA